MRRTFNRGIGLIPIGVPGDAEDVLAALLEAGETAFVCGQRLRRQCPRGRWTWAAR